MDYTLEEAQTFLKESLSNGSMLVTFTKKDGSERQMRCTLNIPESKQAKTEGKTSTRSVPTTSLAVYDLEVDGWRSFRWDSITKVEAL